MKAQLEIDKQFEITADKMFGDRKDAVLNNAKDLIAKYAPEEFKTKMNTASNEVLLTFASVLDSFVKDHVKEDNISGGVPSGGDAKDTVASLRAKAVKLFNSDAYKSKFHPDHGGTMTQIDEIYAKIAKINK